MPNKTTMEFGKIGITKQRIAALLLCALVVLSMPAMGQQTKLVHVSTAELRSVRRKIDPKLLPDGAIEIEVEDKQVFNLVIRNQRLFTVVPVLFRAPVDVVYTQGVATGCGIYLIPASGTDRFMWAIGREEPGIVMCGGVTSMRLDRHVDSNPDIELTFDAYTLHNNFSVPGTLHWDKNSNEYHLDTYGP